MLIFKVFGIKIANIIALNVGSIQWKLRKFVLERVCQ